MKRLVQRGIALTMMLAMPAFGCHGQTAAATDNQRQAAIALEQQGDTAGAEAAWRAFLKLHPANAEANAHVGFLEARQEHYKEAVPFYRKALALNPAMPGLRLNQGLALFKSGALNEAVQTFTALLKSQPRSSPEALRLTTLIGLAHYGLGEYKEAVPYLKEATAGDAQNLPFRLALAHSCLWSKQYQCVLDVYREILTLNAESAEADMLAGEALDEMKDSAGAAQQFRAAVKADPREPNVHFGLGYLLWGQLHYEEAAQEFQAELANNPDHAQALAYLADTDMRLSHPEAAPPLLEKAIRIDPKIASAHLDLGILYSDAGRKDDALRELKIAEKLTPGDQNVHYRLGRFYQSMGRKDEAKAEFDKTRGLQKAADQSVFDKLHQAQAKGKPAEEAPGAPLAQ
ncbi:MAG: tetratricopeptide repeat protein [Terracidiphilus sp.]|nr:tetratricopeptide repeat protein [Terracidiphilus sp.]